MKVNSLVNLKCKAGILSLPENRALLINSLNPIQASTTAIVKNNKIIMAGQLLRELVIIKINVKTRNSSVKRITRKFEYEKKIFNTIRIVKGNKRDRRELLVNKQKINKSRTIKKTLVRL